MVDRVLMWCYMGLQSDVTPGLRHRALGLGFDWLQDDRAQSQPGGRGLDGRVCTRVLQPDRQQAHWYGNFDIVAATSKPPKPPNHQTPKPLNHFGTTSTFPSFFFSIHHPARAV